MATTGFSSAKSKSRFGATSVLTVVSLLFWVCDSMGQSTSQKTAATFQDFLKSCGYSPLQLEPDNGHLFIRGKIGAKKCRLLVDTGCPLTRLAPELAGGLKSLKELNAEYDDPFVKRFQREDVVLIPVIKFNSGEFRNQPALIDKIEFDYIPIVEKAVLGSDFFNRNHVIIDYLDEKLWVRASDPPPSVANTLAETLTNNGFVNVPLTLDFEPGISCESFVDGHPCRFVIDTGAPWTLLDREHVKPWRLKTLYRARDIDIIGVGEVGSHDLQEAQLGCFQLGLLNVTNTYVGLANLGAWKIPGLHGLIGAELLATRGALIDYSSRTLWLRRRETKY